jgi:hypothetical protein
MYTTVGAPVEAAAAAAEAAAHAAAEAAAAAAWMTEREAGFDVVRSLSSRARV